MYVGLGTVKAFSLSGTSHYVAPIAAWQLPNGVTFSISPGFGLNANSHRFLLRWGMTYESGGFVQAEAGRNGKRDAGFGLNENSHRFLLRWGMTYEIGGFGRKVRS